MRHFKTVLLVAAMLLSFSILSNAQGGIQISNPTQRIMLTVWSNSNQYGPAKVYYGGKYMGSVTLFYRSEPSVGASGCVTFTYTTGPHASVIRIESDEGYIWHTEANVHRVGDSEGTLRVYCYGEKKKTSSYSSSSYSSSSSSSSSGRSSYSSGYDNSGESSAYRLGGQIGSSLVNSVGNAVIGASTVYMDGYPNLQLQAGWSSQFGEYVAVGSDLGGMGGVYLQGTFHKDLFAKEKTRGLDAWGFRLGFYGGDEEHTFRFNIAGYQKYSLPKNPAAVGVELNYSRYFMPRLGINIGVGGYGYDKAHNQSGFLFDFNIGLAYKLFSK